MKLSLVAPVLLFASMSVMAASPATTQADSAKTFVQAFYDWYVPLALKPQNGFSYEIVLKQKPDYFTPVLRAALARDSEASKKSPDYIVGLDFDPVLASQDPCNHYSAETVTEVGKNYDVTVFCESEHESYVSAEVMPQGNSWVIVNFIYPPHDGLKKDDLLTLLKRLKESRTNLQ